MNHDNFRTLMGYETEEQKEIRAVIEYLQEFADRLDKLTEAVNTQNERIAKIEKDLAGVSPAT